MTRTTDITTFSDLRQNMRKRIDRLKKSGRPLYITTNGEPDAVVLSPQSFDRLMEKADRVAHLANLAEIDAGLADVEAGRVHDFRTAIREIAKKHGLTLDTKPHRKSGR